MTPPAVGLGTLSRLHETVVGTTVLSVYLDVGPDRAADCEAQFTRLTLGLRWPQGDFAAARVRAMLSCVSMLAYGTRGIALFVAADGAQTLVPLPVAVEPMAVLDCVPWLEPLTGMLTSGDWGAAIVDWRTVRLLRGGSGGLIEFAFLDEGVRVRRAMAACSASARLGWGHQHGLECGKLLVDMLARAHRRRPFDRIAVAAPPELWTLIEPQLAKTLRERLVGLLAIERVADGKLRRELSTLLACAAVGEDLRGAHSTSTTLRGQRARTLNHTTGRLMAPMPHRPLVGHSDSCSIEREAPAPGRLGCAVQPAGDELQFAITEI